MLAIDDVSAGRLDADVLVSTVPASAQVPDAARRSGRHPAGLRRGLRALADPARPARQTKSGQRVVSGLDLLVAQAVNQVVAMTGRFDVPVGAMRRAAEDALASRTGE